MIVQANAADAVLGAPAEGLSLLKTLKAIEILEFPAFRVLSRDNRSIARLSASVPSRHTQFSAAFTTNIAESNFRYTQASE